MIEKEKELNPALLWNGISTWRIPYNNWKLKFRLSPNLGFSFGFEKNQLDS